MKNLKKLLAASFVSILLIPISILGQTQISGDLTGSLGPGTFIVVGDCNVPANQNLTIAPGTTLLFSGHHSLFVYGQLNADGTVTDSINFVRQYPTEACKHGGIRFQSSASSNSTLSYCLIDYAKNTSYPNYYGGGIYCTNGGLTISNCWISNCQASSGGGLYSTSTPVVVTDCVFMNNTAGNGGGVYLNGCNDAEVMNSVFARNSSTST